MLTLGSMLVISTNDVVDQAASIIDLLTCDLSLIIVPNLVLVFEIFCDTCVT